jgi:hypothetical protein
VNIHFVEPKTGELEMLAGAGFKWVRVDLSWVETERRKGEYDFSAYERLAATLHRLGIRPIFTLDYGNPLYAEPADTAPFTSRAHQREFREAFAKWAVAARMRFLDSTAQFFQSSGPKIDWLGWRQVTFPMRTAGQHLEHWDGDDDGVIHYPIELDSILVLDNAARTPVEGSIYLSAPTLNF